MKTEEVELYLPKIKLETSMVLDQMLDQLGLKEAYKEIEKYDTSSPMMGNTQKVYTGLTYGRHSLNEDLAMVCANRGYMA